MQINKSTTKNQNIYLIIIFGPPASGKTTLASTLYQSILEKCGQENIKRDDLVIVSADSFQEFLRGHKEDELRQLMDQNHSLKIFSENRIKRNVFDEQIWKKSRQFIKINVSSWLQRHRIVIIEDDMLLKSQRKYFRHIAEQKKVKYLQIMVKRSYEQCLLNAKKRENYLQSVQQRISLDILKNSFQKFQIQENRYLQVIETEEVIYWTDIQPKATIVVIQHPQLLVKIKQKCQIIDQVDQEVRIRKFISEIIRSKQLQLKYCQQVTSQQIPTYLSLAKKKYHSKAKTLQGFIEFLNSETTKIPKT